MSVTARVKPDTTRVDVVVIGTGFSGLGMAIALLKDGRKDFVVLERADSVGGTWRDNSYPGCACDIRAHLYSFSFEQNPTWSRLYPTQPEIRAYLDKVADDYGVRPHIRFGKTVSAMRFDEAAKRWDVETADGSRFNARVVVSGMGGLANPLIPRLKGAEDFRGAAFHSAQWDHGYDLAGKSVAVIGTGASAIQFVPQIAGKVGQLHLFQRTPPWIAPKLDRPMKPWEKTLFSLLPFTQTWFRGAIYCRNEMGAMGFAHPERMAKMQEMLMGYLRHAVRDPGLRQKLTPGYTLGCKRILISNDYYPALQRPNVELVTDAIDHLTRDGVVTADGTERKVDAIIYGTGFAAMDPMAGIEVTGVGGRSLSDDWAHGPQAYLGLSVAGYPNLFLLMGPNTGLGHNSMVYMIESQINYVMDALRLLDRKRAGLMEVRANAQAAFNTELQAQVATSVWNTGGCKSWYLNGEGRNTALWPGYTFVYRRRTRKVDPAAYVVGEA